MSRIRIEVWKCECERCGYSWITRDIKIPSVCARCRSRIWEKVKGEIEKLVNRTEIEIRKVEKTKVEVKKINKPIEIKDDDYIEQVYVKDGYSQEED